MPFVPGSFLPRTRTFIKAARRTGFVAALWLACGTSPGLCADPAVTSDTSEVELTNFAFANYLGSGLYSSGDNKLFIMQVPLTSDLIEGSEDKASLVLRYPLALGVGLVGDEDFPEIAELIDIDNFVTLSMMPGLEYIVPVNPIWKLAPFFDLGFARDFANDVSFTIGGSGVKSFINLEFESSRLLIANRLLFARQKNLDSNNTSRFTSFETGLEYTFPTEWSFDGYPLDFSLYFINYYYLEDLVQGSSADVRISLENKNEAGFTFALPKHDWLPADSRLGFGVQVTRDEDFYRIVFGAPFF